MAQPTWDRRTYSKKKFVKIKPLNAEENDVYTAEKGCAFNPVTVNVASGDGDAPALNPMLHVMVSCTLDQQELDPTYDVPVVINAYIGNDPVCSCAVISSDNGPYIGVPGSCKIKASMPVEVTIDTVTCVALDLNDETVETYSSDSEGYIQLPDAMPADATKLIMMINGHGEGVPGGNIVA